MTLVDIGSPVVLFSTRDKKFVSGLSKTEIQNITNNYYISSGGAVPWICSLRATSYIAVGIGRMFRLIRVGNMGLTPHIWLDAKGTIVVMNGNGDLVRIFSQYWREYHISSYYLTPGLGDYKGIFQLGDDKIFIKKGRSIAAYGWNNETSGLGEKKWETSVSGVIGDIQWNKEENELVVPTWDPFYQQTYPSVLIDADDGRIKASRNFSHNSWAVAIDKYGRYWFQQAHGKWITVCNSDDLTLANITINGTSYNGTFEVPFINHSYSISENSNFDILMTDRCGHYAAFFSAEDDYSNMIRVSLDVNSAGATPMGESGFFFLSSTKEDNWEEHSNTFYLMNPDSQTLLPITMPSGAVIARGDPGLVRWKTWGRSWKPKISAIYDYVFNPTES